jgi:hypothetical protein
MILLFDDVINHDLHASHLIELQGDIQSGLSSFVQVKERKIGIEILIVLVIEKVFDRSLIKGKERKHAFRPQLQEDLEEYPWIRLTLHQVLDISLCSHSIDTLKKQELSQSNFINF